MRAAMAPLLALAILSGSGGLQASATSGDGTDAALQREMERLYALRTVDVPAFVAQTRSLEAQPKPSNLGQRQFLQFLAANRATFEGRIPEAIEQALPLAESAEDASLRLLAATFVINMRAGTRDFEVGLRELDRLLKAYPDAEGPLRAEIIGLWHVAAIFYAELDQPELSAWYAKRLLENQPSPRINCSAQLFVSRARQATGDPSLSSRDFERADQACNDAGEKGVLPGFIALSHARFLRDRAQGDAALRLLEQRLGLIESTRYPRLVAEVYALDAELLLEAGRIGQAERQARRAIDISKDSPTSLPVAMAEKVLFEIHRQRNDSRGALQHLQRHIAANRGLADESLAKERAFRTVQHESLQREQQLTLAAERNRVLDLEARLAKAESRNAFVLAVVLLLTVAGLVAWGRRLWADAQRFRELAQTDPLTGFATRQHFNELAADALARGRSAARPLMLVAFDLDHFKRINDRHGHLAGDAVLRAVSAAVLAVKAPVPRVVGRIGGEEFAVLLDGASEAEAAAHAEALREAIAAARTLVETGASLAVTASFGLTGTHEAGHDLQALLERSDRALYRAKHGGRDRIVADDRDRALEAA